MKDPLFICFPSVAYLTTPFGARGYFLNFNSFIFSVWRDNQTLIKKKLSFRFVLSQVLPVPH